MNSEIIIKLVKPSSKIRYREEDFVVTTLVNKRGVLCVSLQSGELKYLDHFQSVQIDSTRCLKFVQFKFEEISDCVGYISDYMLNYYFTALTRWEREFLESMKNQLFNFSPKQKYTFECVVSETILGTKKRRKSSYNYNDYDCVDEDLLSDLGYDHSFFY